LQRFLTKAGVKYQFNTIVTNIEFQITNTTKIAKNICCLVNNKQQNIRLHNNDYVYITNGSCVENATHGNNVTAAKINNDKGPV
jgi:oleate hydratase